MGKAVSQPAGDQVGDRDRNCEQAITTIVMDFNLGDKKWKKLDFHMHGYEFDAKWPEWQCRALEDAIRWIPVAEKTEDRASISLAGFGHRLEHGQVFCRFDENGEINLTLYKQDTKYRAMHHGDQPCLQLGKLNAGEGDFWYYNHKY